MKNSQNEKAWSVITTRDIYRVPDGSGRGKASTSHEAQIEVLEYYIGYLTGESIVAVEHPDLAKIEVLDEAGYRQACE